jgi:hypothetical protein
LDNDGSTDMAVSQGNDADVSVLLNNGDGTFAPAVGYGAMGLPHSVALADLDGDGWIDMTVGNGTTCNVSVFLNLCESPCPADINGDSTVNVLDLLLVLAAWGNTSGPEDINGDGIVNVLDILEVLAAWGPCA